MTGSMGAMPPIDWTQVLLAVVTTIGTVVTVWLTSKAKTHAAEASKSAYAAVQASLRPGRYPGLPSAPPESSEGERGN